MLKTKLLLLKHFNFITYPVHDGMQLLGSCCDGSRAQRSGYASMCTQQGCSTISPRSVFKSWLGLSLLYSKLSRKETLFFVAPYAIWFSGLLIFSMPSGNRTVNNSPFTNTTRRIALRDNYGLQTIRQSFPNTGGPWPIQLWPHNSQAGCHHLLPLTDVLRALPEFTGLGSPPCTA